ncbi:MAG: carboxylesterase [Gammaproteobacteria bacterium]|nr:carboxylesterase [Gammaproteobacteria bacterium]
MTGQLETVEVVTGQAPEFSVIWLHGLGADGHDFEPIVPALTLPVPMRFVFPHAPERAVTINQGMRMRAWYDILSLERFSVEDEAGIRASEALLIGLIEAELARGIAVQRIILAGFSQGGAIALHTGLRYPQTLGGIMVLSAYLPLRGSVEAERSAANAGTSIFMAHGSADATIPEALAIQSGQALRSYGYDLDWHSYPMAHQVCAQELADISSWIDRCVSAAAG